MEGCDQPVSLLRGDGGAVFEAGQDSNAFFFVNISNLGSADEDGGERLAVAAAKVAYLEARLEAVHLPAEGVTLHLDVHQPQQRLVNADVAGHEDHTGTGAPDWLLSGKIEQRLHKPVLHSQLADGRAFTAGNTQTVQPFKMLGQTNLNSLHTQLLQYLNMFNERAL